MNPRKPREIKASLVKKGFKEEQRDHSFLFLYVEGKKSSVRTKISHVTREYSPNLLSLIARQLHISNQEFNDLLDCPMEYNDYVNILKEKQILQL